MDIRRATSKRTVIFSPKLASFQNWRLVWRLAVNFPIQIICQELQALYIIAGEISMGLFLTCLPRLISALH